MHCPLTKQLCIALCTMECGLASEWITRAHPHFYQLFFQDLEHWDSLDLPNFPSLYPKTCQEPCLLQNIHPLQLQEECLLAYCNPNIHCSTQFCARFLVQQNACFVNLYLFRRTKWVALNIPNCSMSLFNARHVASKIDRVENWRQKDFYSKAKE